MFDPFNSPEAKLARSMADSPAAKLARDLAEGPNARFARQLADKAVPIEPAVVETRITVHVEPAPRVEVKSGSPYVTATICAAD